MTNEDDEVTDVAVIDAAERGVSPQRQIDQMAELVQAIASRCTGPQFISTIDGKQYPKVEWWTTVGATQGLSASEVYSKRVTCIKHDGEHWGYEAKAEVHDNTGKLRSSASMVCMSCEARSRHGYKCGESAKRGICACGAKWGSPKNTWGDAGEYAVKSMAYTRAVSKSYRVNLSYLAVMADLQPTAAEEVPEGGFGDSQDSGHGTCSIPEHNNAAFFQTPKMKSPAHKYIENGKTRWCNKPQGEPEPERPASGAHNGPKPGSGAGGHCAEHDMPWLKNSSGRFAHPIKEGNTLVGWCNRDEVLTGDAKADARELDAQAEAHLREVADEAPATQEERLFEDEEAESEVRH